MAAEGVDSFKFIQEKSLVRAVILSLACLGLQLCHSRQDPLLRTSPAFPKSTDEAPRFSLLFSSLSLSSPPCPYAGGRDEPHTCDSANMATRGEIRAILGRARRHRERSKLSVPPTIILSRGNEAKGEGRKERRGEREKKKKKTEDRRGEREELKNRKRALQMKKSDVIPTRCWSIYST